MRKIIAGLFISLDGVVEAPETWHFPYFNDEMGEAVTAQAEAADTMLLGRKTYEEFAAFWPNQSSEEPFADVMNGTPKLVASTTLKDGRVAELHAHRGRRRRGPQAASRSSPARPSPSPVARPSCARCCAPGVLDELRLLVHPIVVGHGKRLFETEDQPIPLRLVEAKTFTTGVQAMTYAPRRLAESRDESKSMTRRTR